MDELIAGTYEGFLIGYTLLPRDNVMKLKQTFATHSHTSAVRCVASSDRYFASGGTDDKVVIIDLLTRKEHTVLVNHEGTVNTVIFTCGGTHLLSGSDDGSIIVTRTGNWQTEKIWKKAHGGHPVTAIAIHPSDKLALSVGGDKTLRTWNLVKGRPAFTINLGSKGVVMPTEIYFAPSGDRFVLISQQHVDIWTINKAGLEKRVTCTSKPASVEWLNDDRIFVGLDNGNIITLTVSGPDALTYKAHKERVKCLYYNNSTLYSASSAGEFKVWFVSDDSLQEVCSTNASCRITCLALNRHDEYVKKADDPIEESGDSDDSDNESVDSGNEDGTEVDDDGEVENPVGNEQNVAKHNDNNKDDSDQDDNDEDGDDDGDDDDDDDDEDDNDEDSDQGSGDLGQDGDDQDGDDQDGDEQDGDEQDGDEQDGDDQDSNDQDSDDQDSNDHDNNDHHDSNHQHNKRDGNEDTTKRDGSYVSVSYEEESDDNDENMMPLHPRASKRRKQNE